LTWQCERYHYKIYPVLSRLAQRPIESGLLIYDLTDGSVRKMASRGVLSMLQLATKMMQDYYPETMGQCLVVNAPMVFSALYAIIKGFLDERTRSKIRIVGSNYQQVLLEAIDAENLPEFLGGTCTCSHVEGGCINSDTGPWQDYVLINNRPRHKDELLSTEQEEEKKEPATNSDVELGQAAASLQKQNW